MRDNRKVYVREGKQKIEWRGKNSPLLGPPKYGVCVSAAGPHKPPDSVT